MRRFEASYRRVGGGWQATVTKPSLTAGGRTLESARSAAAEAIAAHYGVDPSIVVLRDDVELADPAQRAVDVALAARDAVVAAQQAHAQRQHEAVRALADAGLSMRDSGYLLGLSHSRVQQLLNAPDTGGDR